MWFNSRVPYPRFKVKSTKLTGINISNGHSTKSKTSKIRFLDVEPKILYRLVLVPFKNPHFYQWLVFQGPGRKRPDGRAEIRYFFGTGGIGTRYLKTVHSASVFRYFLKRVIQYLYFGTVSRYFGKKLMHVKISSKPFKAFKYISDPV